MFSISTTLRICKRGQYHDCDSRGSKASPYVDGAESGTVTGSHVLVQGLDGISPRHLAELLVHVVGSGARVVTDPDTEVLDLQGALLVDLNREYTS